MPDAKLGIVHFRLDVESVDFMSVVKFFQKTLVRAFWEATLFVQQIEDTQFLWRERE